MTRHEDYRKTERNVRRLVKTLSRMAPDEIADALEKRDIKGVPGAPNICPIATYFRSVLGSRSVSIYTFGLYVGTPLGQIYEDHGFHKFLTRVDTDAYPELIG